MDTSETYIKMSDCPEIQGKQPQGYFGVSGNSYGNSSKGLIWLPRQDQLQRMVQFSGGLLNQLWHFKDFCFARDNGYNFEYILSLNSMEQLWLAFVMKEKYNKFWNNEKWVNE